MHGISIAITLTKTAYFSKVEYYVSFRSNITSASHVRACIMFLLMTVEIKKNLLGDFLK
jgi:hypothetical protein